MSSCSIAVLFSIPTKPYYATVFCYDYIIVLRIAESVLTHYIYCSRLYSLMLYKSPSKMAGGDSKLSFSVENILKDHRKSSNENGQAHCSAGELQLPTQRSSHIMRNKLTRRHYSTSSIETIGLGSGYRGHSASSSLITDSDYIECRSLDTYNSSPSPLSSPRSVASLPQECLQGNLVSNGLSV